MRRSDRSNQPPTPTPPPVDDDVTAVLSDWQNMLHRHLTPPPNQVRPVGPLPSPSPRSTDEFRHAQPNAPVPQRTYQPPNTPDPTDIGAQIYQGQQNQINQNPIQLQRVLEYYGNPQIRDIRVVLGYQVHAALPQGVLITENGPTMHRTLIPWHRVHDLKFAPGDPILNNL